jgi:hypothetical protein
MMPIARAWKEAAKDWRRDARNTHALYVEALATWHDEYVKRQAAEARAEAAEALVRRMGEALWLAHRWKHSGDSMAAGRCTSVFCREIVIALRDPLAVRLMEERGRDGD